MIQLTESAAQHIKKNIAAQENLNQPNEQNSVGFRLSVKKMGCTGYGYVTDIVADAPESDIHLNVNGINIFVDAQAVDVLKGTTIDWVEQGLGQKVLIFNNPNAVNACGCGESFNVEKRDDAVE